jgi:hypothetical protein
MTVGFRYYPVCLCNSEFVSGEEITIDVETFTAGAAAPDCPWVKGAQRPTKY